MQTPRAWGLSRPAALLSVFLPYLFSDTVFDNRRTMQELGQSPPPFEGYAHDLLRWAKEQRFSYPYRPWPASS
jgi:hypothetical protein